MLAGWESESNKDLMPAINTLQAVIVSCLLNATHEQNTVELTSLCRFPQKHARKNRNDHVALIAGLAKFRVIMANSYLDIAPDSMAEVKELLTAGKVFPRPTDGESNDLTNLQPVLAVMLAQFLILAVPLETRRGNVQASTEYLNLLHQLMDRSDALNGDAQTAVGRLQVSPKPLSRYSFVLTPV